MNEVLFREQLVRLLTSGHAHASAEQALTNVRPEFRNISPSSGLHSIWEDLEHMRIAQEDILHYMIDPGWQSPSFPEGYWPSVTAQLSDDSWNASLSWFFKDLESSVALVRDTSIDLTSVIPHAQKHTYLREIYLIADHNAYHVGQIVQARKLLGDWPPSPAA